MKHNIKQGQQLIQLVESLVKTILKLCFNLYIPLVFNSEKDYISSEHLRFNTKSKEKSVVNKCILKVQLFLEAAWACCNASCGPAAAKWERLTLLLSLKTNVMWFFRQAIFWNMFPHMLQCQLWESSRQERTSYIAVVSENQWCGSLGSRQARMWVTVLLFENKYNQCSVTMYPTGQALWRQIWKRTMERSQMNSKWEQNVWYWCLRKLKVKQGWNRLSAR